MRKATIAVLLCAGALAACGDKDDAAVQGAAVDAADTPAAAGGEAMASAAGDEATPAADVAAPTDKPVRKAGLWEITSTGPGGGTSTLCVSNATEASQRGHAFATLGGGGMGGRGGPGGPGGPRGPGGPDGPRPGGGPDGDGPRMGGGGGFGGGPAMCQPKIAKAGDNWTATTDCTREMGEMTMKTTGKMTLTGDLSTRYTVKGSRTMSGGPQDRTTEINVTATYKGVCPAGMQPGDLTGPSGQTRNVLQGRGGGPRQG